jgi:hypothetical protein
VSAVVPLGEPPAAGGGEPVGRHGDEVLYCIALLPRGTQRPVQEACAVFK